LGSKADCNLRYGGIWTPEIAAVLKGRDIVYLEDNDQAGREKSAKAGWALAGIARTVRIANFTDLPEGSDVSDWIGIDPEKHDAEALAERCRNAPLFDPKPAAGDAQPRLIYSSAEFIAGFIRPDYLIDGLVQRRFIYSLTAPTGTGKTAVALLLCACIALGRAVGEYQVAQGRVLYLAGENPDDVRMRWLAMAQVMGFDINTIPVSFLPGVFKLSEMADRIRAELEKIGPVALIVVDTSAAYFEGSEENANVEMGVHARRLRDLVKMPGGPSVLVCCHPVKNAGPDNLLPRGGGAFVAT
jgi:hypothetical protein